MKLLLISLFTILPFCAFAQDKLEWSDNYILTLSDFRSVETEINKDLKSYSVQSGAQIEFSYQMSSYEFMFTKNFNSKATAVFHRNAAYIVSVDSSSAQPLVDYAQYNFDLTELYTRKFRKRILEEKGAFSNTQFFQPIYDQLQREMSAENARVSKLTDLGSKSELLELERTKVLAEIHLLGDYCKTCKPPKKKKKK